MMLATMLSQTDVVWTWLPACSPLVCLLGLLGIVLLGKWPNARDASTLIAGVANLGIVIAMTVEVLGNGTILGTYFTEAAPGLTLAFTRSREAKELMDYYWDTVDQCVPRATIVDAMTKAGFDGATCKTVIPGAFCEYTARKLESEG